MQEIRFTTLEGRQGVFIPTAGGCPQITMDDSKTKFRYPGGVQDDIFKSPEQFEVERAIKNAQDAAEDHIAQKKTADRLNRLEAEVKELRELWSKAEMTAAEGQKQYKARAIDVEKFVVHEIKSLYACIKEGEGELAKLKKEVAGLREPVGEYSAERCAKDSFIRPDLRSPVSDPSLNDAVCRLRKALAEDPELYLGYQNNIAMAFYYEGMRGCSPTVSNGAAMYTVADKAAKRFLDNFIHPIEKA